MMVAYLTQPSMVPNVITLISAHQCVAVSKHLPKFLIDYVHHVNPETPIEETMRALAELKA